MMNFVLKTRNFVLKIDEFCRPLHCRGLRRRRHSPIHGDGCRQHRQLVSPRALHLADLLRLVLSAALLVGGVMQRLYFPTIPGSSIQTCDKMWDFPLISSSFPLKSQGRGDIRHTRRPPSAPAAQISTVRSDVSQRAQSGARIAFH